MLGEFTITLDDACSKDPAFYVSQSSGVTMHSFDLTSDSGIGFTSYPSSADGIAHVSANAVGAAATTPLPPTLVLFLTGLGGIGFQGWRRRAARPAPL